MTLNELLQAILPRFGAETPKGTFFDAANAVLDVVQQRLWLASSDFLKATVTTTLRAGYSKFSLPSGTLGLAEYPWITNTEITPGRRVIPLPPDLRHTFTDNNHPQYFEQRGLSLIFYPTALVDTTVKNEVYRRPDLFVSLDDEIPWDGMFDQVFVEATQRFNVAGGMITITPEMTAFINQRVDMLIDHRPAKSITWVYPV